MSDIAPENKAESALLAAAELIDVKNGLIKLLDPPASDDNFFGYISRYPKGVRENGGQYTHGAVWYIMALLEAGHTDEGFKLLRMINPLEKCADKTLAEKYKGEPYVLSADVYAGATNGGRAGWSWYTGSAAWLYICILEKLFGIRLVGGSLEIRPKRLPKGMEIVKIEYKARGSLYNIQISKGDEDAFTIDVINVKNGNVLPIKENETKNVEVKIFYS